jgi:hypothetical protein
MIPILREDDLIQLKDGRKGIVYYINRRIKHYQVNIEMIIMSWFLIRDVKENT